MDSEARRALRRRLTHLGLDQPTAARLEGSSLPRQPAPLDPRLAAGVEVETALGSAWVIEQWFPLAQAHGHRRLDEILKIDPSSAAFVAGRPGFERATVRDWLFLDTETTGLAGGAGTLVFLVGIGGLEGDGFRLRQFFLRSPVEEAAMLQALLPHLSQAAGLVSFNGATFDLPLLETRYRIAQRRGLGLDQQPHLDLLHPSRRLWRHTLPDCSLGTLERLILGVERTVEDVPGSMIPGLYLDYLRSGQTGEMDRVLYHNTQDILSLVRLAREVVGRFTEAPQQALTGPEALGVARWNLSAGRHPEAESALQIAASAEEDQVRLTAYREYGLVLRQEGRFEEAVGLWRTWHAQAPEDPEPCIELAKHFEWRERDFTQAQHWAAEGMGALSHWPDDWRRREMWESIEHRLTRLARKLER